MATLRVAAKPQAARMMAAQISKPGADFEIVEREIPEPSAGQVRLKVQASGVCHSDVLTKERALARRVSTVAFATWIGITKSNLASAVGRHISS